MDQNNFNEKIEQIKNNEITNLSLHGKNLQLEQIEILARVLATNTSLEYLDLGRNEINHEGAEFIADALKINTRLQIINLECNLIDAEASKFIADALKVNTTLQLIILKSNVINHEGAEFIADALKVNTGLQTINLECNLIGAEGVKFIAEALEDNTNLKAIYIENNRIYDQASEFIAEWFEKNYSILNVGFNYREKSDELNMLKVTTRNKEIKKYAEKGGYCASLEYFFSEVIPDTMGVGSLLDPLLFEGNYLTPAEQRNIHINARLLENRVNESHNLAGECNAETLDTDTLG